MGRDRQGHLAAARRHGAMSLHANPHRTVLQMDEALLPDPEVRSEMTLKVRASCPCGCDLRSATLVLQAADRTLASSRSGEFAVPAPEAPGPCSWIVRFPQQEIGDVVHEETSLPVTFVTRPLRCSLAIWNAPSTVVTGERFTVRIGAKSPASCVLKGAAVEVRDDEGTIVGSGRLGDVPWEGTAALYWTAIELPAPSKPGIASWSVRFLPAEMEGGLPHDEAAASFSFAAVRPPDHRLTITLVDRHASTPIENAHIRLGPFRALTDASGIARVALPKGTYEITVWHAGYETDTATVDIADADVALRLMGTAVPEEDPSAWWAM
jgi:hypothetical protein